MSTLMTIGKGHYTLPRSQVDCWNNGIDTQDAVLVSVVVLVDDRDVSDECMGILLNQKCPFHYEIVLVDSSVGKVASRFSDESAVRVFAIPPSSFEFGKTRDFGFSHTRGKVIVTLSQDVIPFGEDYLQTMVEPILSGVADVVQGTTLVPPTASVFYWEVQEAFYFTSESLRFERDHGGMGLSAVSLSMKREAWQATGFAPTLCCEDKLIQKRLWHKGYRFLELAAPSAFHGHNYNLQSLIQRCFWEGKGWACIDVKYGLLTMLWDVLSGQKLYFGKLVHGVLSGRVTTAAELLFFLVRPVSIFLGNAYIRWFHQAK